MELNKMSFTYLKLQSAYSQIIFLNPLAVSTVGKNYTANGLEVLNIGFYGKGRSITVVGRAEKILAKIAEIKGSSKFEWREEISVSGNRVAILNSQPDHTETRLIDCGLQKDGLAYYQTQHSILYIERYPGHDISEIHNSDGLIIPTTALLPDLFLDADIVDLYIKNR